MCSRQGALKSKNIHIEPNFREQIFILSLRLEGQMHNLELQKFHINKVYSKALRNCYFLILPT